MFRTTSLSSAGHSKRLTLIRFSSGAASRSEKNEKLGRLVGASNQYYDLTANDMAGRRTFALDDDGVNEVDPRTRERVETTRTTWINPPSVRGVSPARAPEPVPSPPTVTPAPMAPMAPIAPVAPAPVQLEEKVTYKQETVGPIPGPIPPPPMIQVTGAGPVLQPAYAQPAYQPVYAQPSLPQTTTVALTQRVERSQQDIQAEIRRLELQKELDRLERRDMPAPPQLYLGAQPYYGPAQYQNLHFPRPRSKSVGRHVEFVKEPEREKGKSSAHLEVCIHANTHRRKEGESQAGQGHAGDIDIA